MKMHLLVKFSRNTSLLGTLLLGLAPAFAGANTYYVSPGGSDTNDGTSWETAFATPYKGFITVNGKNRSDEVLIAPGTYELSGAIGCNGGQDEYTRVMVRGTTDNPEDVVLRSPGDQEVLRLAKNITVANMTFENGTNYKRYYQGAAGIRVGGNSNLGTLSIVSNCVVRNCRNEAGNGGYGGAAVVLNDGLLVDCVVSNNMAIWRGCGVAMMGMDATVLRCTITGNIATNITNGGGAVVGLGTTTNLLSCGHLVDCTISTNTGSNYAGAINIADVSGCLFEGNKSSLNGSRGGGICLLNDSADISQCVFRNNSSLDGGGVGIVKATASLSDCLFDSNAAQNSGGGVFVSGAANVSFDNCQFLGNSTTAGIGDNNGGGGLFIAGQTASDGWCSVSNCIFVGNSAGARGGALGFTWNGWAHGAIGNCIFTNNTSVLQGGGLSIREGQSNVHADNVLTVRNSLIAFNKTTSTASGATQGGGIILVTKNDVEVSNCTIADNVTSATSSGGIHQRWGGRLINCILANNKAKSGAIDEPNTGNAICTDPDGTFLNCCSWPTTTEHLTAANKCINDDPLFTDEENGDFTLGKRSPCRNTGRALDWMTKGTFDLSGLVARISESAPEMGCYEIPEPVKRTLLMFR